MSPATALEFDPVVPQRDVLLDRDEVGRRLAAGLGAHGSLAIDSCERVLATYRVGRRVRVLYRIEVAGRSHLVAASSFRSSSRSERAYRLTMEHAQNGGPLRPALHDSDLQTVFSTFPNDRRLPGLSAVAEPSHGLARVLDGRWTSSVFVDYVPESSAVARCLDDSKQVVAFAKVHAGDEGERTYLAHSALWRRACGSELRISCPIAYSKQQRALLVAPVEGIAISQLTGREVLDGLHAYGAALATLHSLPLVEMPPLERDLLGRIRRHAGNVGLVRPDARAPVDLLVRELGRRWGESEGPEVVHGDANTNNAILQGSRVAFIDFDRVAIGSAASGIGNFLSILAYLRCLGLISSSSENARAEAFKRGYSFVRPLPDAASLRVRTSAGLVERAIRAINCLRPNALRRVPQLLTEARWLLGV